MNERKCVYAFFLLEWLYHSKLEAGRLKVDEQIDRFDYFSAWLCLENGLAPDFAESIGKLHLLRDPLLGYFLLSFRL